MKKLILLLVLVMVVVIAGETITLDKFNSGELSPYMGARYDLPQYQVGLRELTNMVVEPQGGVAKRPGTYYIGGTVGEVPGTPAIPATYTLTYFGENSDVWGVPLSDVGTLTLDTGGEVRNVGGGIVGIPCTGHPFIEGESIVITGTDQYGDGYTLTEGTTENELQFVDEYIAETFDGTETVVKYIGTQGKSGSLGWADRDPDGNIYVPVVKVEGSCILKIAVDSTQTYDFLTWPESPVFTIGKQVKVSQDGLYLYALLAGTAPSVIKFNLSSGAVEWLATANLTKDFDVDSSGNVYVFQNGGIRKLDAETGEVLVTYTGLNNPTYKGFSVLSGNLMDNIVVDEDIGVVMAAGQTLCTASQLELEGIYLHDFGVSNLDGSASDTVILGDLTYYSVWPYIVQTQQVGVGHVVSYDGYIYVLICIYGATPTQHAIYKIQWTGSEIVVVDTFTGYLPSQTCGIYFDLWGNLVIVNNSPVYGPGDATFWFYDVDGNYLGNTGNFQNGMLDWWNPTAGWAITRGSSFFDGVLGTETPGVPADVGEDITGEPVRLIDYTYRTEKSYIVECGQHYMVFYKEAD